MQVIRFKKPFVDKFLFNLVKFFIKYLHTRLLPLIFVEFSFYYMRQSNAKLLVNYSNRKLLYE